jgi:8-oxo-dGTP diphosphatase
VTSGPVLLQRRTWWSHHGGTWGLPGGARDSHESALAAALREAAEECEVPPDAVRPRGVFTDDHGGWSYTTVLAEAEKQFAVRADDDESDEVAWVPLPLIMGLDLHPGLAAHWVELSRELSPVTIIVDSANVVGSRPDGWWRDRPGAAVRLRDELAPLAERGITELPDAVSRVPADGLTQMRWLPDVVQVVEGAARPAAVSPGDSRVRVVATEGSGDDAIAALAAQTAGRRIVVTADRELRARCAAAGASVVGPSWLFSQL